LQLGDVLADLQMLLRRLVGEKIELDLKHGRDLWLVKADLNQFEQVVVNLVVNARDAMADGGKISLRTRNVTSAECALFRQPTLTAADYVAIEVEDTGIGISQEQQSKVFERFSQATVQTQAMYGGNGLGLAISKRLVELMGGDIGVRSQLGKGSVFWFNVPLVPTEPKRANLVQSPRFVKLQQEPWRFLIVDDVQMNRLLLRQILKLEYPNADMTEAEDGLDALNHVKNEHFDLVFMDMIMPQMDGIEASKSIRSIVDAQGHHLPILGLSANVNSVDRDRFIQAGADDFLLKPYDRQTLVEITERLLSTRTHATQ
jgi:two-component system cell cycle sensor histidine kinase/response regulator CckA